MILKTSLKKEQTAPLQKEVYQIQEFPEPPIEIQPLKTEVMANGHVGLHKN